MCYHAEFGRYLYVGYKRIQKNPHLNWEALELRSVGWKEWPTPRYTPLSDMCYHIKFGSSASKMEGNLKIGLSLVGVGQANLLEIRSSPTCYPAEFDRSGSNGSSVIKEIRLKNVTLVFRLSRSLKVIGTDMYRSATYDFLFKVS